MPNVDDVQTGEVLERSNLRILFVSDGNPEDPSASGSGSPAFLIASMRRLGAQVRAVDGGLSGLGRYVAAATTFSSDRKRWRARFRLGDRPFRARSALASARVRSLESEFDCVLQYGNDLLPVIGSRLPLYLYSDNFAEHTVDASFSNIAQLDERERGIAIRNEQRVFDTATHIFTMSEYIRRQFISRLGLPPEKLTAVHAGANLAVPPVEPAPSSGPRTALFVGRDWVSKGGPALLSAFRRVRDRLPDCRLVVVGPRECPAELAGEPGVVFAGYLPKSDPNAARQLSEIYASSHVFCFPTGYDSFGIVALEAMTYGLPVIITRAGAFPEIVADGETGFTVELNDVDVLADRLGRLLSDRDLATAMGERGRTRVQQRFTWPVVARRILSGIAATRVGEPATGLPR